MDEEIERFDVPTLAQLAPLKSNSVDDAVLVKVQAVLQRWLDDRDFSQEDALQACDELLDTHGIESVDPEGAPSYTDEGIRMCPPFSYCNAGDAYATTLGRCHRTGRWVVACWADMLGEVERDEKLGDFEEFDEEPERCPSCGKRDCFTLEFFPGSSRGPSFSWVCSSCNHHCFAEDDDGAVKIGEDDNGNDAQVKALRLQGEDGYTFVVLVDGVQWAPKSATAPNTWDDAEDARRAFLDAGKDGEDDGDPYGA